jgi:hypothetical protein
MLPSHPNPSYNSLMRSAGQVVLTLFFLLALGFAQDKPKAVLGAFAGNGSDIEGKFKIEFTISPLDDPVQDRVTGTLVKFDSHGNVVTKTFNGYYNRKQEVFKATYAHRNNGEVFYQAVNGNYDSKSGMFLVGVEFVNTDEILEVDCKKVTEPNRGVKPTVKPPANPKKLPPVKKPPVSAKSPPKITTPRADPNVWGLVEVVQDPYHLAGTFENGSTKVDVAVNHYRRTVKSYRDAAKTIIDNDFTLDVRFQSPPQIIHKGDIFKLTVCATSMKNAATMSEKTFGLYRSFGNLEDKLISAGKGSPEGNWADPWVGIDANGNFEPTASGIWQLSSKNMNPGDRFQIDEVAFGCLVARFWYEKGKPPIKVPG